MTNQNYKLSPVPIVELTSLARFIVDENVKHHGEDEEANSTESIANIVKAEANFFKNSYYYVYRNNFDEIVGSIRLLRWNYIDSLPIEKIFGINPMLHTSYASEPIWHIGSFATKKGIKSITLFKKLMLHAISPICEMEKGIAFAECDYKLFRVMNIMGINAKVIGSSIFYLGSETLPILLSYQSLIEFYNKNKHLLNCASNKNLEQYNLFAKGELTYKPVA